MSSSFSGILVVPYTGQPYTGNISACTPPTMPPSMVPIVIDWNTPWQAAGNPTSLGVKVNLQANNPRGDRLDAVRSVKIDNTGSTASISVIFPSSGDVVTCPPFAVVTDNVIAMDFEPVIYASGLEAGFIPTTKVFFMNIPRAPLFDPERSVSFPQLIGSPNIQRDNISTPGFGQAALGDQFYFGSLNMQGLGGTTDAIWNTPHPEAYLYVTSIVFRHGAFNSSNPSLAMEFALENSDTLEELLVVPFISVAAAGSSSASQWLMALGPMNLRLDATVNWRLRNSGNSQNNGSVQMFSSYSVNDN